MWWRVRVPSWGLLIAQAENHLRGNAGRLLHEQILVHGPVARLGDIDHVATHQFDEALVERLHADILARLDRRVHLRDLAFADQIADRGIADHDLMRREPALTILGL